MYRILIVATCITALATPAFSAITTFSPSVTGGLTYTDNVNRTKDKEEDVVATVSPGAALDITGHRAGLTLSYYPTYAAYRTNSQYDDWRHYAGLGFWWDLSSRTRLDITDSLTISEDPADAVDDLSGTRRGRARYKTNSTGINVGHRFGPSDTFDLGYNFSTTLNDDEAYEDNRQHNPYGKMTWWFAPGKYGLDLKADFSRGEFDRSDDFDSWLGEVKLRRLLNSRLDVYLEYSYINTTYSGESEDYQLHDTGIGFNYVIGDRVSTSFTLSYLRLERDVSGDENDVFLSWDINATWPLRMGSVGLRGSSGYTQDQFAAGGRGFSLYSGLVGDINWRFTRTLSGNASASYRYNKYIDFEPDEENHTVNAGAGLSWQALAWMRFNLDYNYTQLFSDNEISEYDENRLYFSMSLSPRKPIDVFN